MQHQGELSGNHSSKMLSGNFVTNIRRGEANGGWSGMNAALFEELSKVFDLQYAGPINPPMDWLNRVNSGLKRKLGGNGNYHFFSDRRLKRIASEVERSTIDSACFTLFHGITPWIRTSPQVPTFAFADACFATYLQTYHRNEKFRATDLKRVFDQEEKWLGQIDRVFFTSQWAMDDCRKHYGIEGPNFECVHMGAALEAPDTDRYQGSRDLVFVAVDYHRKGGDICLGAFQKYRKHFSDAKLTFIGAKPPTAALQTSGVHWAGFLRKDRTDERNELCHLFSSAFALVLPTMSDMTPLVIVEAGHHGCPTLAPRCFGIPEMIRHNETGLLLPSPPSADDFAQALITLAQDGHRYLDMRRAVREISRNNFTWSKVAQRIASSIHSTGKAS